MEDKYYYSKNLLQFVFVILFNVFIVFVLLKSDPEPGYFLAHLIISIGAGIVFWALGYVGAGIGLIFFYPVALLIGFGLYLTFLPEIWQI